MYAHLVLILMFPATEEASHGKEFRAQGEEAEVVAYFSPGFGQYFGSP